SRGRAGDRSRVPQTVCLFGCAAVSGIGGRQESIAHSSEGAMMKVAPISLALAILAGTQARQPDAGTLAGRVMHDDGPVGRALVSIDIGDGRAERVTATNDDGQFAFNQLPSGRYLVKASKYGWVTTHYGSPRPGRPPGTRVAVDSTAPVSITIPMIP